jgi:hypothetical protein
MAVRLTEDPPEQILSIAQLHDDQDKTAKKVEDLSDEGFGGGACQSTWQRINHWCKGDSSTVVIK